METKACDIECIHCDYCKREIKGRKFIFQVIGHTFIMCSITCRDYIKQQLGCSGN